LVRGAARVATSQTANRGWSARFDSAASELDLESRRELADHWTRLGLMEHASVAAFARFALDLLSLGAPAELMLETQRALGDEIAHATLCFGLASRYAGHEIGPGVLPLEGALDARSSWEIIETLIVEACVGETLAAAEAEAALFGTRDPQVRDVLERIVSDEARHAELGWRALCWMLRDADAALVARAEQALDAAIERVRFEPLADGSRALAASADHGLLGGRERDTARSLAVTGVLLPCAAALKTALRRATPFARRSATRRVQSQIAS